MRRLSCLVVWCCFGFHSAVISILLVSSQSVYESKPVSLNRSKWKDDCEETRWFYQSPEVTVVKAWSYYQEPFREKTCLHGPYGPNNLNIMRRFFLSDHGFIGNGQNKRELLIEFRAWQMCEMTKTPIKVTLSEEPKWGEYGSAVQLFSQDIPARQSSQDCSKFNWTDFGEGQTIDPWKYPWSDHYSILLKPWLPKTKQDIDLYIASFSCFREHSQNPPFKACFKDVQLWANVRTLTNVTLMIGADLRFGMWDRAWAISHVRLSLNNPRPTPYPTFSPTQPTSRPTHRPSKETPSPTKPAVKPLPSSQSGGNQTVLIPVPAPKPPGIGNGTSSNGTIPSPASPAHSGTSGANGTTGNATQPGQIPGKTPIKPTVKTDSPTSAPTFAPSNSPTTSPSDSPTLRPTNATESPTGHPSPKHTPPPTWHRYPGFGAKLGYIDDDDIELEVTVPADRTEDFHVKCGAWLINDEYSTAQVRGSYLWNTSMDGISHIPDGPPLYTRDSIPQSRPNRTLLFRKLSMANDRKSVYRVLCSATVATLEEVSRNPIAAAEFVLVGDFEMTDRGVGFAGDPRFVRASGHSLRINVMVSDDERVRCVLTSIMDALDLPPFLNVSNFWSLTQPTMNESHRYKKWSIGEFNPVSLGNNIAMNRVRDPKTGNFPAKQLNTEVEVTVKHLSMATRYRGYCATFPSEQSMNNGKVNYLRSSNLYPIFPRYFSTRGDSEAIRALIPDHLVSGQHTKVYLDTEERGDNYFKMVALVEENIRDCKQSDMLISKSFLEWQSQTVTINVKSIGRFRVCFSGDGGEHWWIQDHPNAIVIVSAAPRHAIVSVSPQWAQIGYDSTIHIRGSHPFYAIGDGFTKKVSLSTDRCNHTLNEVFIAINSSEFQVILQDSLRYSLCYSDDYGKHWTLQVSPHLVLSGYRTQLGPQNAQLAQLIFKDTTLVPPFQPSVSHYQAFVDDRLREVSVLAKPYESQSTIQVIHNGGDHHHSLDPTRHTYFHVKAGHLGIDTEFIFIVTAPDGRSQNRYYVSLKSSGIAHSQRITAIHPTSARSGETTVFTLDPPIVGDDRYEKRVGFALIDGDTLDCSMPDAVAIIDGSSQVNVSLDWEYFGNAQFAVCLTTDRGRNWLKQDQLRVTVNATLRRLPYHIAALTVTLATLCCCGFGFRNKDKDEFEIEKDKETEK